MDIFDKGERVQFCNTELLGDKSRFSSPESNAMSREKLTGIPLAFQGNTAKWLSFCRATDLVFRKK